MTIIHANHFPLFLIEQKLKSGLELPDLCSTVIRTLCNGDSIWNADRFINFNLFCHLLTIQMNITPPILYTGLKYFQSILINSKNEYDIIDLSHVGHEYSLLTISILLAYKYLDDHPPSMKQWSFVTMIPVDTLVSLESYALQTLGYSLSIPVHEFNQWTEQCNTVYEMSRLSLDYLQFIDLHQTQHKFGYHTLLPVVLDEYYILSINDTQQFIDEQQYWPTSILL